MMRSSIFVVVCCAMFVVLQSQHCHAQIVPYKLTGTGVADPSAGTFWGPSWATHMGKLTYFAQATSIVPTATGFDYTAIDTQTAADGSEIFLMGSGSATLHHITGNWYTATWDGEWIILGGTGRFANVGPGTAPIQLDMTQAPFDITNLTDLRSFVYTKMGDIDLGRK